jgi:hypothetical protein
MMLHSFLCVIFLAESVLAFQSNLLAPSTFSFNEKPSHSLHPNQGFNSIQVSHFPPIVQRQASQTSSDLRDVISSKAAIVGSVLERSSLYQSAQAGGKVFFDLRDVISSKAAIVGSVLERSSLYQSAQAGGKVFSKCWWISPMFLALVPIYCALVKGTCARMPSWWQVFNMDHVLKAKSAAVVVGCFLFSNIAYFLSGTYLLNRFPFQRNGKSTAFKPTRFSMLGVWILAAGLVSTIFHSVQALGPYPVAEALCYVDHGVAISASFYFCDTCGLPSRRVCAIGLAGIAALVITEPGYAWLHSTWH